MIRYRSRIVKNRVWFNKDKSYINVIKIKNFSKKLNLIYSGISEIISHYCPYEVAIEEVFISYF